MSVYINAFRIGQAVTWKATPGNPITPGAGTVDAIYLGQNGRLAYRVERHEMPKGASCNRYELLQEDGMEPTP